MPATPIRQRALPILRRWLLSTLCIYLLVAGLVFLIQRQLQYLPYPDAGFPTGTAFRALQDVELTTSDGLLLRAWHWPGARPVTLVIFHGNAGHRGHRLGWMQSLRQLGFGVFIVDYRGYGGSEGSPTEKGLYLDAEAALAWLDAHQPGEQVYIGESLGCGVAVEMARRKPPLALILHSGFSSAVDVGQHAYWFLPVGILMKDRYENLAKIREVCCPLLMIHGHEDRIIPPRFGRRLFTAAQEPKEWLEIPGAGHNDLIDVGGQAYLDKIREFLSQSLPKPTKD